MPRSNLFLSILLLPLGAYADPPGATEHPLLAHCLSMTDDTRRLACYDQLARTADASPATTTTEHTIVSPVALTASQPQSPSDATARAQPGSTAPSATPPTDDALAQRLSDEQRDRNNPFLIRAYKPNYILFATYTPTNLARPVYDFSPQHAEAKYQLSFQFNWWDKPLGKNTAFYFGYTQLSFWQLYNSDFLGSKASAPFRETNYEPEIGLDLTTHAQIAGLEVRKVRFSFIHQSNGQGGLRSRSWNRLALQTAFGSGRFAGALRGWYRIPEARATDDNPDIVDYLGYGDLTLAYKLDDGLLSATIHNNLQRQNRGSIELDYSFPINKHLKAYAQYFNGYGESLIDYNRSISRFGIGIALTDWL